jgi:hypothetical protein
MGDGGGDSMKRKPNAAVLTRRSHFHWFIGASLHAIDFQQSIATPSGK